MFDDRDDFTGVYLQVESCPTLIAVMKNYQINLLLNVISFIIQLCMISFFELKN